MKSIKERILAFNSDRNKEIIPIKYKKMKENASRFFRGSCHLFYEDLYNNQLLLNAPKVWLCGDLHLENFGCYKAADNHLYFDINDFDESELAPLLFDVCRILVSIYVFGNDLKIKKKHLHRLTSMFWDEYILNIKNGKSYCFHLNNSRGEIKDLIQNSTDLEVDFLKTSKNKKPKKIKIENEDTFKLKKKSKVVLKEKLKETLANNPIFKNYQILDIVGLIAGTGSLGLERYLVLINQKSNKNYELIDLKKARKSCINSYNSVPQPNWQVESQRISFAQHLLQFQTPKLLQNWVVGTDNYNARYYDPSQSKVDLEKIASHPENFEYMILDFAKLLAWSHVRAAGRQSSDTYQTINEWVENQNIKELLLQTSSDYAIKVKKDFIHFNKK